MPIPTLETIRTFFQKKAVRPILTIAALRENPWTVISHDLPAEPTQLLLNAARLAATYVRESEYLFMRAARDGEYVPTWWDDTPETPDAHEESEELCYTADETLNGICELLGEAVEEPAG